MDRKEITNKLKRAAVGYWVKKKYSVHTEIGLESWGRTRADLLCINLKGNVIVCEVKSCYQDFASDTKWKSYLNKCNKLYFVISHQLYSSNKGLKLIEAVKQEGVGVLVLDPLSGYLRVRVKCKDRHLHKQQVLNLALRMLWRDGLNSKKTRRTKVFI